MFFILCWDTSHALDLAEKGVVGLMGGDGVNGSGTKGLIGGGSVKGGVAGGLGGENWSDATVVYTGGGTPIISFVCLRGLSYWI